MQLTFIRFFAIVFLVLIAFALVLAVFWFFSPSAASASVIDSRDVPSFSVPCTRLLSFPSDVSVTFDAVFMIDGGATSHLRSSKFIFLPDALGVVVDNFYYSLDDFVSYLEDSPLYFVDITSYNSLQSLYYFFSDCAFGEDFSTSDGTLYYPFFNAEGIFFGNYSNYDIVDFIEVAVAGLDFQDVPLFFAASSGSSYYSRITSDDLILFQFDYSLPYPYYGVDYIFCYSDQDADTFFYHNLSYYFAPFDFKKSSAFSFVQASPGGDYDRGYQEGYFDGFDTGQNIANSTVNKSSASYAAGYNNGVADSGNYTFFGLISAVLEVPVRTIISLFDFDILGVNIWSFVASLLAIATVLAIVRFVL